MANIFKRRQSPFYVCSYRAADGRWLKKSTKSKDRKVALEFCMKLEEAERGALQRTLTTSQARKLFNEILERAGDEPLESFSVAGWLKEWLSMKSSSRTSGTSARYEKPLTDFIEHLGTRADLPLRALTSKDVRSFRDAEIKTGKSPVTVNLTHKTIAGALYAAVRQGFILNNPAAAIDYLPTHDDRGEKGTFTLDEIAKLIKAAPSDDWKGVILLGAYSGLRLGDSLRLTWGNLDLENLALTLTPRKTARTGKKLLIPMHPMLQDFFLHHPVGQRDTDPVFPTLASLGIGGRSGASMAFSRIMKQAKLAAGTLREARGESGRNVSARSYHSLRHGFVTALSAANVPIELRQKLAGHSTSGMSLHYTHPDFAALRAAVESLPSK
jgi:integrase